MKKRPKSESKGKPVEPSSSEPKTAVASDEITRSPTPTPATASSTPGAAPSIGIGPVLVVAVGIAGLLFLLNRESSGEAEPPAGERYVRSGAASTDSTDEAPTPTAVAAAPMTVRVIGSFPHDPRAFTQGLEYVDGELYEGTGIRRRSTIRRVALETGEVLQTVDLPPEVFGEGITVLGDRIWQISWVEERAFLRNRSDFSLIREAEYDGEGWGLCHDATRIVMSDGSDELFFRDPETFEVTGSVHVTLAGNPLDMLNELECVEGLVYANVWQTDHIARIDPTTGAVTGWIDTALHTDNEVGRRLLDADEAENADVLNGIAWMPDRGHFLIGGKEWPRSFEVEFVPMPPD